MYFLGEEKLNKAIEELKFVEAEKRENAIAGEQKKMEELQATIDQLRVVRIELNIKSSTMISLL